MNIHALWGHIVRVRTAAFRVALAASGIAGIASCAALKTPESQLLGRPSRHQSAAVVYRVETRAAHDSATDRSALAKILDPSFKSQNAIGRTTTLAVQFPHPAGRAGYARVECIVETPRANNGGPSGAFAWLDRARKIVEESTPGVTWGEGVQEALALDIPIAELERVLDRLEQPPAATGTASTRSVASLSGTVNGAAVKARSGRIAEFDQLVARVRRDGSIISHNRPTREPIVEPTPAAVSVTTAAGQQADATSQAKPALAESMAKGAVVPVSFQEPILERLPPVDASDP